MAVERIFKDEASEEKGERARMASFVGAMAIADLVKTTLGPKGMDKILQSTGRGREVTVTNDGATILKSLHIDNPAAKVLVDISKVQDDEVGDGTTSVAVLAGELLREAEKLVAAKIHPMTIISGYRMAAECARNALLQKVVDNKEDSEKFKSDLMKIAMTTLSSKILSQDKEHFAQLAVDAVMRLKGSTNLESIQIIKKPGGSLKDSFLDEGFILDKKIGIGQPKRIENAKILVANTAMDTDKVKIYGARVRVDSMSKAAEIEGAEKQKMREKVQKIIGHGINCFVNRQLIYNFPEELFADAGILAIEHADFDGIERLALVTGGEIASTFDNPESVKLGHCKLIYCLRKFPKQHSLRIKKMFRLTTNLASKLGLTKNTVHPISYKLSSIRSYAAGANIQSGDKGIPYSDSNLSQKTGDLDVKDKIFVPGSISDDGGASFMQYLASCEGLSNQLRNLRAECIVYHALVFEGCKAKNAGVNSEYVEYGVFDAREAVKDFFMSRARMVSKNEELAQIVTRAVKGDKKICELVAKAVEVVGKEATIVISNSEASNDQLEFVNGMMVQHFFIERYCNLVKKSSTHVFKNPLILIHEDKESIKSVLKEVIDQAEDAPIITVGGFSEITKKMLQDLATLTGGQVLTKELNTNFTPQMFGSCKEVAKTNKGIAILGGSGDRTKIEERCEQLRSEIKTNGDKRNKLRLTLANLSNGAAVLKFVGKLDKLQEKKVLVDKALSVAKTVADSGVVDDRGVMLLHASKELDKLETQNFDEKFGVQLVKNALKMPVYVAASAAGFNGSFVVQKLLEQDNPNLGYDLTRGEFLNVTEYGIAELAEYFRKDFFQSVGDALCKIDFDYKNEDEDDDAGGD